MNIEKLRVSSYQIPTDLPEADGTLAWNSTTLVLVELFGGGKKGIGFTYSHRAAAVLIHDLLSPLIIGQDPMDIGKLWQNMLRNIRNLGRPGISSMAIAAVDTALWDLKANVLQVPLATLLGACRPAIPIYGSGGFTSYSIPQLQAQFANWGEQGIKRVKMKVGTHPPADEDRVRAAREAIGPDVELFVDANGAYSRKEALEKAERFAKYGVKWFEEPVSSDDLEGLRLLRDGAPAGMDIAAGEYGFDPFYFSRMLEAGAVDVLQADATRCGGISGFLEVGALCAAKTLKLSAHTAPTIHAHPCCSIPSATHLEYFHDHVRIERMFFEGVIFPRNGALAPDLSRPGLGIEFREEDAKKYAA